MFTTIAVALDLEANGDRALPVVRTLSELGDVEVELLTVDSPNVPLAVDDFELSRRATANGWPAHSYQALRSNDVAAAIVDHLRGRDEVLLVMATTAKRPVVGHLLGSVTERVLATIDQPVLLVGPGVPTELSWTAPTPVLCIDATDIAEEAVPTVASWIHTFRSARPCVAEVVARAELQPGAQRDPDSSHVRQYVSELRAAGLDPSLIVMYDEDPEAGLFGVAGRIAEPLLVTTSNRWTDGRLHWRSITRQLVHRSTAPILVVPARRHGTAEVLTDAAAS